MILFVLATTMSPAVAPPVRPTMRTVAALDPAMTRGHGADVPFDEFEGENGVTNGESVGPDRRFGTLAAEASGRRAVRLAGTGRFVEFTLPRAANAITVRYAVPDSADGRGTDSTLGLYVAGQRIGAFETTSRYSWLYGKYPFTNRPGDGGGHHVFDHARMLLGRTLPAGTRVRIMVGPGDAAGWYVVDLVDFEQVTGPLKQPPGSFAVTCYGADPTGRDDAGPAFRQAIAAARARRRTVWIPAGTFRIDRHLELYDVTVQGAGVWHSTLRGHGVGLYGKRSAGGAGRVILRDFAIIGEVGERRDDQQLAGIGGAFGDGSRIENLWLQHHKVGLWFDGPMNRIRVSGLRIYDMTADGLNFRRGVTHALVEHVFVRGTGDDGLAAWSEGQADSHIVFRRNTIVAPDLANGIAIYGGRDIAAADNLIADTVTQGGGLHVGNRFGAVAAAGTLRLSGNMLVRSGSFDPNWRFGIGALWFYALDHPLTADVRVTDTDIVDPSEEAMLFIGKAVTNVRADRIRIVQGAAPQVTLRSAGQARISHLSANGGNAFEVRTCQRDLPFDLSFDRAAVVTFDRLCEADATGRP